MWKKLAAALAVAAVMGSTAPAEAKDMSGKFGVGLNQSLTSGITGLGLNYWVGNLKLGGILGMDFFFPDGGDAETVVGIGLQALYAIARAEDANLNFGLRVNFGIRDPGAADTTFGVQFDIPIEAEYFLSDHFSIFGHVGLTLTIIGEDGNPLDPRGKGVGFGVGTGGFSGGAGFTFYF